MDPLGWSWAETQFAREAVRLMQTWPCDGSLVDSEHPRDMGSRLQRAACAVVAGDTAGAERLLAEVLDADEDYRDAHLAFAALLEAQGEWSAACVAYRWALRIDVTASAWAFLARAAYRDGDLQAGYDALNSGVRAVGSAQDAVRLGVVAFQAGESKLAKAIFSASAQHLNAGPVALAGAALASRAMMQEDEAEWWLSSALAEAKAEPLRSRGLRARAAAVA